MTPAVQKPATDERLLDVIGKSKWLMLSLCLSWSWAFTQSPTNSATTSTATNAPVDKAGIAVLKKAKSSYQAGQYKEAAEKLKALVKQPGKSATVEEALIMLADIELRQNHNDQVNALVARFRRYYGTSPQLARINYYQGHASLRQGKNSEAAKAFALAAATAPNVGLQLSATKGLWHLVDNAGLPTEDLEALLEILDRDQGLKATMLERIGDQYLREGRYQAARNTFEDWLEHFKKHEGVSRIKGKLKQATEAPQQNRTVLLMAPMTGEYMEIGKSVKEGALLAIDESNAKGTGGRIETRILDDQGNLIVGIHRLRKTMREEKIDAIIGPAMSDVSAAAAVDLSARKSKVAMVTPTATTHGIAALGEGIFQLNVTTGTLGQRVAAYAVGCLKLKDFAIVAPNSEYGFQLAEAFQKTVEKKGGNIITTQYYEPDATDLAPQFAEVRKQAVKIYFEKLKAETGAPDPDAKTYAKALADSTLIIDGIFMPATNGEETYKVASQAPFNKLRAQFLGSSGWNDKTIMHRSGANVLVGSIFSVDFQENPKTETWMAFNRTFAARWKHPPDKVAALAYDGAKFLLQGMAGAASDDKLIPSLKAIRSFNGVLGRITFDEKYGANTNAALYRIDKKGFVEIESCPEAD
jgi:ABC-type branched-subunit amino acid transport system substrate-binding protein/predicted negative regulator of RcsB-dependent stress response